MTRDLYKILQVDPSADPEVIEAAYTRLKKKFTQTPLPDPQAQTARLAELDLAFVTLADPARRARYDGGDRDLEEPAPAVSPALVSNAQVSAPEMPPAGEESQTTTAPETIPKHQPASGNKLRQGWQFVTHPRQNASAWRKVLLYGLALVPLAGLILTQLVAMPVLADQVTAGYQANQAVQARAYQNQPSGNRTAGTTVPSLPIQVKELDFQRAFTLSAETPLRITKIVATRGHLFLLDALLGKIIHLARSENGYQQDRAFPCGTALAAGSITGIPVDIAPINSGMATQYLNGIFGIDQQGNYFACAPSAGEGGLMQLAPPDAGWGRVTGLEIYSGDLFVLDAGKNALYSYANYGSGSASFYFDSQVPDLSIVSDWTILQNNLVLINQDGTATLCASQSLYGNVTCKNALFKGHGLEPDGVLALPNTWFSQVAQNQPASQSLYLLEPYQQVVYHLNQSFEVLELLGTANPLPVEAVSAFAIGPDRMLYLVLGNQVYTALLP